MAECRQCLICLEDYDPEEDLRLLTCRHVFHRDCVDRWLETGRNNCPACRSQVRDLSNDDICLLILLSGGVHQQPRVDPYSFLSLICRVGT
jgi:hypothetical protein